MLVFHGIGEGTDAVEGGQIEGQHLTAFRPGSSASAGADDDLRIGLRNNLLNGACTEPGGGSCHDDNLV